MAADFDWEREGLVVGATLDAAHAVVVLGDDPDATARVALGIGRAQSGRRRVAVGDLLGEAPPIQSLVEGDDAHGIVDSFVYGVSLNRIARPVAEAGELFVMPSGSEPVDHAEILPHPRWRRLASGFREVGALLILAAPASAPGAAELVAMTDGAVLVGEMVPSGLPVAQVLAGVRAPRPTPAGSAVPTPAPVPQAEPVVPAQPTEGRAARLLRLGLAPALVLALVALGFWLFMRPMDHSAKRPVEIPKDTSRVASVPAMAPVVGTTAGATSGAADSLAAVDTTRPPGAVAGPVSNPADSLKAAGWAVVFKNFNTPAGVLLTLHEARNTVPAATFAPVQQQGSRWYQLVAGAFANRKSADSLLAAMRALREPELEPVGVVRMPYAYLVHANVGAPDAARLVGQLVERGHPAYAMRQADGTINIYVGAFESPAQAALLASSLQASGLAPTLAFRLGRAF